MAVNSLGEMYIVGITNSDSPTFPLYNAYQTTRDNGFISKFISSGSALVFSTYLGDQDVFSPEYINSIDVDASGIYIAGYTSSPNYPLVSEYQSWSASDDMIISKFNPAGSSLIYSTYLGGGGADAANSIQVVAGYLYIGGQSNSDDFPVVNPYQGSHADVIYPNKQDGIFVKLSSSGSELLYSTYCGGEGNDYIFGLAVDALGQAYGSGQTQSDNYPAINGFQNSINYNTDTIITKLSSSGSELVYSSYYGGKGTDECRSIDVLENQAYICGYTASDDISMVNAYQASYADTNESYDAFICKVSSSGSAITYSSYFGGANLDQCLSIKVNSLSEIHVVGNTLSDNFPVLSAYQGTGGKQDMFMARFGSTGSTLIYSTYLGGSEDDFAKSLCCIGNMVYIGGYSSVDSDFPIYNAYQDTRAGDTDGNLMIIGP